MDTEEKQIPNWLFIFSVSILAIVVVCSYYNIKDVCGDNRQIKEDREKGEKCVKKEMSNYFETFRRNDQLADSIIQTFNEKRKEVGEPIYEIRFLADFEDTYEEKKVRWDTDDYWIKNKRNYGICRFTDKDNIFAEGLLFHLNKPEQQMPMHIFISGDGYIGYARGMNGRFRIKLR